MPKTTNTDILKKQLVEALEKSLGVVTTAVKTVGIHRSTFYDWYNDDEAFRKEVDGIGEIAVDFAEFELAWSNTEKNARIIEHHWSGEKKLHPTMKPIPVMGWCLSFLKSEIIFDPFLGSGSTMVAAHQLKRKCYGMELDNKYCQVIIDRMLKLDEDLEVKVNGKQYKIKELANV